jgi:hypothetical protein
MLSRAFWLNYLRCPRGYAISMNPGDGSPNRIVRLMSHFRWAPTGLAATLELFSLSAEQMRASEALIREHRGEVSYLSLAGKKDIVLTSSGAPMKLLHVQFGPCAEPGLPQPQEGAVHMLCAPSGDALALALCSRGLLPSATASVIHHRMGKADWRFVLTSDI